jgi:hypothetical protein
VVCDEAWIGIDTILEFGLKYRVRARAGMALANREVDGAARGNKRRTALDVVLVAEPSLPQNWIQLAPNTPNMPTE